MDDIDQDIQRSQIGKRSESLVNPHPKKEKSSSSYLMPPQNVNYHKNKGRNSLYHQSTGNEHSTKSGSWWWIVGLVVVVILFTKFMGFW